MLVLSFYVLVFKMFVLLAPYVCFHRDTDGRPQAASVALSGNTCKSHVFVYEGKKSFVRSSIKNNLFLE